MSHRDAKNNYDKTPANKSGYTWGQNVGWFCFDFAPAPPPPPPPVRWTVSGQTNVNRTTASPGQVIDWSHSIRNNGPNHMNESVRYGIDRSGFSDPTYNNDTGDEIKRRQMRNGESFPISPSTGNKTRYTVRDQDLGRNLCQRVFWQKRAWNDTNFGRTDFRCVSIPFSYNLIPRIAMNPDRDVVDESMDEISLTARVHNGGSTRSERSETTVTRIKVAKGVDIAEEIRENNGGTNSACADYRGRYNNGIRDCNLIVQNTGTKSRVFNAGTTTIIEDGNINNSISDMNLEVGEQVCYITSVNNYTGSRNNSDWRHSVPTCAKVVKKPKVQIHGGDLVVGRAQPGGGVNSSAEVKTSSTTKRIDGSLRTFGSWVEYGIFAPRIVESVSGAALAGEPGADAASGSSLDYLNKLTFENINRYGWYSDNTGTRPDVRAQFSGGQTGCSADMVLDDRSGVYNCNSAVNVRGNLALGKTVVIKAPRIVITENVTYSSDPIAELGQIPQLVLIADNIVINGNVERVDGWLIGDSQAGGSNGWVVSCPDGRTGPWTDTSYVAGPRGLSSEVCNRQLSVNGPVMSNRLFLRRTAGSDAGAASNNPAEVINLRADAYLWASRYGSNDNKITTTYTRDLAPRF